MLAQILKFNATSIAKRALPANSIRMIEPCRYKSYGSSEVQHGDHHGEADHHGHHDRYQELYERLWRNKATIDWLPKPEGSWQEANAKTQAYYNKVLAGGVVSSILAYFYFRKFIIEQCGVLTKPPYHLIGHEDFPGSKYLDAAETKKQ